MFAFGKNWKVETLELKVISLMIIQNIVLFRIRNCIFILTIQLNVRYNKEVS